MEQPRLSNLDIEKGVESNSHVTHNLEEEFQKTTLINRIKLNARVWRFIRATGNYWPNDGDEDVMWTIIYRSYFLLVRGILLCAVAFSIYYFIEEIGHGNEVGITISFTFFLDVVSVLPSQFLNQKRLQHESVLQDSVEFNTVTGTAEKYTSCCLFIILISIACGVQANPAWTAVVGLTISEACVVFYLGFNLWVLLLDLKVSEALIDELNAGAERKQLNLATFNEVRGFINKRVEDSKWVSDFILIPCVASVITIVIMMFHLKLDNSADVAYTIGWVAALIKEMIFICVAFWFVATVNQKADSLTEKLSCEIWVPSMALPNLDNSAMKMSTNISIDHGDQGNQQTNVLHSHQSSRPPSQISQNNNDYNNYNNNTIGGSFNSYRGSVGSHHSQFLISDIERLTMCVSSLTRPISFTLLFKRVSWQNVLLSFGGVAVTICVGLARSLIMV